MRKTVDVNGEIYAKPDWRKCPECHKDTHHVAPHTIVGSWGPSAKPIMHTVAAEYCSGLLTDECDWSEMVAWEVKS